MASVGLNAEALVIETYKKYVETHVDNLPSDQQNSK